MISERNQMRFEMSKDELVSSKLPVDEKEDLQEALQNALDGTNGLTQEDKLQNVSESVFNLVRLFVRARCEGGAKSWKDVLVAVKRELMWVLFAFFGLLFFHPEIAEIIRGIAK